MIEKIEIEKPKSLDPITIYLDGNRITVICFCDSWTAYFGAVFPDTLRAFLKGVNTDYLAGKFEQSGFRPKRLSKVEKDYLIRVTDAVLEHLKTAN